MSGIKYRFEDIERAAADIHATSANINNLLNDLKQYLAPMVSEWSGESAVAYNEAQRRWDQNAAELNNVLRTIAATVQNGNDRMRDINHRAAQSWS